MAFGIFSGKTGEPAGSDIAIAPVDPGRAGGRAVIVKRDWPGILLAAPTWAPDGSGLVFESVGFTSTAAR